MTTTDMNAVTAKVPTGEHAALGWRLGEVAPDFELLDVWALPVTGGRDEFVDLVATWDAMGDPFSGGGSSVTRLLFSVRERLGHWFGWDDATNELPIPGCAESSLRDRLPDDLAPLALDDTKESPFRPVFETDREWVAELSNSTVHAALQLAWVEAGDGSYTGRLGVYVKSRGRLGPVYMKAIAPFRHYVVYPALLRSIGNAWEKRRARTT